MAHLSRPIVALFQRQLGVAARRQLVSRAPAARVDGLVRHRHLIAVERGVYRLRGGALVPGQRALAAALRAGPGACLTGPAVLGLHGVEGFHADDAFTVLVPAGRRLPAVKFPWRVDRGDARGVSRRGGVRLADPGEAVIDAVERRAELGDRLLRSAVHWLGWRGLLDRERFLAELVERAPGDPNARGLLEALGGLELGRCESEPERSLGRLLACFEPRPEPQVWVSPHRRVDWYFRSLRLAIEYDGAVDHPPGATADGRRDAELRRLGITVVHVTRDQLRDRQKLLRHLAGVIVARALELQVTAPTFDPRAGA
jgi:hypothetical protein